MNYYAMLKDNQSVIFSFDSKAARDTAVENCELETISAKDARYLERSHGADINKWNERHAQRHVRR